MSSAQGGRPSPFVLQAVPLSPALRALLARVCPDATGAVLNVREGRPGELRYAAWCTGDGGVVLPLADTPSAVQDWDALLEGLIRLAPGGLCTFRR